MPEKEKEQPDETELRGWMEQGMLPELAVTRQARSLRTALAMLEAGRVLLEDRSLEELSVESVCQAAGTTVGAFYGRFENKLAFFVTMQRLQILRSQRRLEAFDARRETGASGVDALCEAMVTLTVENFRANVGVLRASLQHTQEGMWNLFKESGDRHRTLMEARFSPYLAHLPPTARRLRILFAYQALAGLLVHSVLNDPGPLRLADAQLEPELVRLLKHYLLAPA